MPTKTSCSRIVTYLKKGPAGQQGPVGRLPVPYGTYGEQSSYTCTDRIAPVVMHNNLYYVMNKNVTWYVANNVTPAQDYANNGSNATWIYMQNYKAIFAEVFMANFGKIASAVFYGNLMFSQQGIVSGAASSNYSELHTDSNGDVDESQASYFKPNFWINFANGKMKALSGSVGGWNMTASRLYSGSSASYVALDSLASNTYAIWAGAEGASSAPFFVKRNGEIKASRGTIGGFTIGTSYLGLANTEGGSPSQSGMSLYNDFIAFSDVETGYYGGKYHSFVGSNVMPDMLGWRGLARFEADGSSGGYNSYGGYCIGVYCSVSGFRYQYAWYCPDGVFAGFRPNTKTEDAGFTLTDMDNVVICQNSANATVYLPSNPKHGQFYMLVHPVETQLTVSCTNGHPIYRVSTGNNNYGWDTSWSSTSRETVILWYDAHRTVTYGGATRTGLWYLTYLKV